MARLPQPGGDAGNWGTVLNDFLKQAHNTDGTLKSISGAQLQDGTVSQTKLSVSGSATNGQVLATDGSSLTWTTVSGGGAVPDADASTKGLVRLTGDLGGTADSPTVPGLAAKADASSVYTKTQVDTSLAAKANTTDVYTKAQVDTSLAGKVGTSDSRLTDQRTPLDGSVATAKIADNAVTEPKLSISNSPAANQVLTWNGTTMAWTTPSGSGGSGDPTMGGDLSGPASNAQIVAGAVGTTELANSAVTATQIADNTITEPKLAASNSPAANQVLSWSGSALAWATPAAGGSGNGSRTTVAKTANYTANAGEYVIGDATSSGFTVTLPTPANGAWVSVKKIDSSVNAILVMAQNSGTVKIDADTSVSVNSQWMDADFISDGTKWFRVG